MDYKQLIDELLQELSYRVGIVNIYNKEHQSIMSEILTEWGEFEAKETIFNFLNEADDKPNKNDDNYVSVGFGNFKYKGKEGEDDPTYKKDDSGNYVKISDDESTGDEKPSKTLTKDVEYQKVVDKEKEIRKKMEADDETKEDSESQSKQENILNKQKTKTLGEVNRDYYDKDINPSDDEYESSKPLQNSDTPTRLPEGLFGTPPKVPKKYQKLVERLINARYINDTNPPMTSMVDGSGAGKIQAQAGEVMSLVFTSLDDRQFEELVRIIREHNAKHEIKKKDGSSYSPPRYPKENQPILTEDWIQSAISTRAGIHERYDAEFGKGNWEIENGAWDLKDEVEAMGLENYSQNKGFSTDIYFRVKNKQSGESVLDEVTLKKDLNIFLSQPSVSAVDTWAFTKEERDEFEKISNRRAELKSKIDNKTATPEEKKEDKKLIERQKELLEKGNSRVPEAANPKAFNEKMRKSATDYYNKLSLQQITLLNSVDDSPEGIKKLAKELNQDVAYTKAFVKVLKSLTHPVSHDELRQKMQEAGFKASKTTSKYLDKFSVMVMRTANMMGDKESSKYLNDHLQIGKDFNKGFVENMVEEPYKSGVMNTIREKFPLKALLEGEEKMSLGGVTADPEILELIFGTRDYDKIEENLTIDGPDENGEYQLVFMIETSGKKIPLSTIAPRQRGLGYEPAVNLEMNLHGAMKEKLYCANVKAGRNFPEKEELASKYNCDSF